MLLMRSERVSEGDRARSARKLLREVGGAVDVPLSVELERALCAIRALHSEVPRSQATTPVNVTSPSFA